MLRKRWFWITVGVLVAMKLCIFTVDETQLVVLTSFGSPVAVVDRAGPYLKWPWLTKIVLDRRLMVYNPPASEFLTSDKKNIIVDNYVLWRVKDPVQFLKVVGTVPAAERALHDIVWGSVSAALGREPIDAVLSPDAGQVKTDRIMAEVTQRCARRAAVDYGVEILDIAIKRLNFPEQNKQSVFDRMRAERERIVKQYRAEGESAAMRIRAEADKKKSEILADAYRDAETVKGQGDAQASRTYAAAYGVDPDFYKFSRTLDSYKKVFGDKTTVVLSSDSELLRLLTKGQ
ncbi:MAG: protease modulator HflC [Armatimonadia bacterium]